MYEYLTIARKQDSSGVCYYPLGRMHSKGYSSHLVCPSFCLGGQSLFTALDLVHGKPS